MKRQVSVYKGFYKGEIVHIGITTQDPRTRFRTHEKRHLIDNFEVITAFDTVEEALALEKKLVLQYKPKYSKRIQQNDNREKTAQEIQKRKGDSEWCQQCYRRRTSRGYRICYWCSAGYTRGENK